MRACGPAAPAGGRCRRMRTVTRASAAGSCNGRWAVPSSISVSSASAASCSDARGRGPPPWPRGPCSPGCSCARRAPSLRNPAWYHDATRVSSRRLMTIPIQVYGINLLVKMMAEAPADVRVNCPKGSPIRYGEVVARGDGFDEGANAFREMPDPKTIVAFEESAEEVEGHYFYIALEEYRVIRLDSVILSFPHE